jgi:hypothetical protein
MQPVILVALGFLMFNTPSFAQQQNDNDATMLGPTIFDISPCAPPCWFGLQAGISSVDDVVEMLSQNSDYFWNDLVEVGRSADNLPMVDAVLDMEQLFQKEPRDSTSFFWIDSTFGGNYIGQNRITLEDDIISFMWIKPDRPVTLQEALEYLGEPASVRATNGFYSNDLFFYYPQLRIILHLTADRSECRMNDLRETFFVEYVEYYSQAAYRSRVAELARYNAHIAPDLWQSWLSGEVTTNCDDAIGDLYRD